MLIEVRRPARALKRWREQVVARHRSYVSNGPTNAKGEDIGLDFATLDWIRRPPPLPDAGDVDAQILEKVVENPGRDLLYPNGEGKMMKN